MPRMRRSLSPLLLAFIASCTPAKPVPPPANAPILQAGGAGLVGRWIFSPGDSTVPDTANESRKPDAKADAAKDGDARADAPKADDAAAHGTSPAGAVLSLAEGGVMFAREGDFVRRGLWKFDGATLRLIAEPPPRRLEMGFAPAVEGDRLTLTGAAGMVLVYHRDPFIAPGRAP
jgi:hypothetical protein